jgi:Leucine-rich repeat (LRR) protein
MIFNESLKCSMFLVVLLLISLTNSQDPCLFERCKCAVEPYGGELLINCNGSSTGENMLPKRNESYTERFRTISVIAFSNYNLETIPDDYFTQLNISILFLTINLETLTENAFRGIKSLFSLTLSGPISNIGKNSFSNLKNLNSFELNKSFKGIEKFNAALNELKVLGNLIYLDLRYISLGSIDKEWFKSFPLLEDLSLEGNELTSLDDATFQYLPRIKKLDLKNNQIDSLDKIYKSLQNLKNLAHLDISGNQLTSIEPYHFEKTTQINILDFSHNRIAKINIDSFKNVGGLKNLYLRNNSLATPLSASLKNSAWLEYYGIGQQNGQLNSLDDYTFERDNQVSLYLSLDGNNIKSFGNKFLCSRISKSKNIIASLRVDLELYNNINKCIFLQMQQFKKNIQISIESNDQQQNLSRVCTCENKNLFAKYQIDLIGACEDFWKGENCSLLFEWIFQ